MPELLCSARQGGRLGSELIGGRQTARLHSQEFVNRQADEVFCESCEGLGMPPPPGRPPGSFVCLVRSPGAGPGQEQTGHHPGGRGFSPDEQVSLEMKLFCSAEDLLLLDPHPSSL